jgi:hypothetical protein
MDIYSIGKGIGIRIRTSISIGISIRISIRMPISIIYPLYPSSNQHRPSQIEG